MSSRVCHTGSTEEANCSTRFLTAHFTGDRRSTVAVNVIDFPPTLVWLFAQTDETARQDDRRPLALLAKRANTTSPGRPFSLSFPQTSVLISLGVCTSFHQRCASPWRYSSSDNTCKSCVSDRRKELDWVLRHGRSLLRCHTPCCGEKQHGGGGFGIFNIQACCRYGWLVPSSLSSSSALWIFSVFHHVCLVA